MRLSQTELDRVLIFNVAEMARRRRAKGLLLNQPEAVALITDEMMELAREGADYETVRAHGCKVLSGRDVLPGVPALLRGLVCEPVFDDGPRIIMLAEPIAVSDAESAVDAVDAVVPGERILSPDPVRINDGRDAVTLSVRNGSDHVVNISSHYHFYEVNPRLEFDRPRAYGRHLDIQAGRSVIWQPGETREVSLVPYAGRRVIDGFLLVPSPSAAQSASATEEA